MKRVIYFIVVVTSIYIINNLVHSILNLSQKNELVVSARQDLKKEQDKYERLKDQLGKVKRKDFVEEEARNKLFLARQGENIVLLPQKRQVISSNSALDAKQNAPNWKQWIDLFL